jgi:hypothetical protein
MTLNAAERYLEYLRNAGSDPVIEAMRRAPLDDEPLTARGKRAIDKGRREAAAGRTLRDAEVRRRARK